MKKDYIYLTYYQMMAFVKKIEQMKLQNQCFNDGVAKMFEDQVLDISLQHLFTPKIIKDVMPIYKISISLFNYLEKLTDVNVLDRKFMKELKKEIIKEQKEFLNKLYNGEYDNLFFNALTKSSQKIKTDKK